MNIHNSLHEMAMKYGANPWEWESIDTEDFSISRGASRTCVVFKAIPVVAKFCFSSRPANEIERNIYKCAQEEGLGRFFAEPFAQIVSDGKVWTLYRKVSYVGRLDLISEFVEPQEAPKDFYNSEYALMEYEECFDWVSYACEDVDFDKLVKFLGDWEITDLHQFNFGYDGHVVFVDYAGY